MKVKSPRDAIAMKCRDCIYDEYAPGTWKKQVDECTSTHCPLHAYRPVYRSSRCRKPQ